MTNSACNHAINFFRLSVLRYSQFAQDMVRDHSAINKAAKQLVTKPGVTPEPSDFSRSLGVNAEKTMTRLSKLHGKAFDRAHINNEAAFHKQVIKTVRTMLIPDAKHPELKQALVKKTTTFGEHLRHAEMIQRHERSHAGAMH